jgi:hypothetical protein
MQSRVEGGPWFKNYMDCDFATEWLYEYYLMSNPSTKE